MRKFGLKVLFLIDVFDKTGGAERNLQLLSRGLKNRGHEVIICALKGGQLTQQLSEEGFHIEDFKLTRIYDIQGLNTLIHGADEPVTQICFSVSDIFVTIDPVV